jgi:hypothetical protein
MTDKTRTQIGWVLSGLFALFMWGASALPKLAGMAIAPETMGWPDSPILLIGVLEAVLTLLFLFPPTALLGGILMMGILGGAMVTQIRAGSPLVSHTLFGVYLGILMWGGLWLRDPAFRALFPWRR